MLDEQQKKMQQRHLNMMRQKIQRDQKLEYENFRNSKLVSFSKEFKLSDERILHRKKLQEYVTKYVFLQNLQPLPSVSEKPDSRSLSILKENYTARDLIKKFLFFRNFFSKFLRVRFFLLVLSAFFFFSFEYYLRYYSYISFNDINVTYEDIIGKIPPFF